MDFDLRLKALARLAQSETDAALAALKQEFERAAKSLVTETQYDLLEQDLQIMEAIGGRFSPDAVRLLLSFQDTVEARQITYSEQAKIFARDISVYQNAHTLKIRALEVLLLFRYAETKSIVHILIQLSRHPAEDVRKKAFEGLKSISRYDLKVFYGEEGQRGLGAIPQAEIVHELEALDDDKLKRFLPAVLTLLEGVLSPTMEGTTWSYQSVTMSRGATPAIPGVAELRGRAVRLLERLYGLTAAVKEKLKVLAGLSHATPQHNLGESREAIAAMVARNAVDVLRFFEALIESEDLQIVQKIESYSYWMYAHSARQDVKEAALRVEAAIGRHGEYQIYRTLVGFEGIFGKWSEVNKASEGYFEKTENERRAKAKEFATDINDHNYGQWRERIIAFAQTESDDLAMFPIFYYFLEAFAIAQPKLAFKLVTEDAERIEGFLIPLLRGLWAGSERPAVRTQIETWAQQGRHLYASIKQFLSNTQLDRVLLGLLLKKAAERDDRPAIALVMSVAVSNFENEKALIDQLFLPALKTLTERKDASWIFDFWFRKEVREVIRALDDRGVDLVLRNLSHLKEIDYHAEEILSVIAERSPQSVLRFLCERLRKDGGEPERMFDAIPFEMHKLNEPLAKSPKEAVRAARSIYDGDYGMFIHGGAHLLKTIFPDFPSSFEAELLEVVAEGGNENLEFVLAVLRNYEGQPFVHNVCKAIVKRLPADSDYRTEVAVALQNTGVVTGAFGFAEAYERKKGEVANWLEDPDGRIREFAKWYIASLEQMSASDRKRAEEEIALRKHRYGD